MAPHGERLAIIRAVVPGSSLGSVLARRDVLTGAEAARITATLAAALGVLHRSGSSHADVGDESVRVTPDGSVVLTGLGVAPARERRRAPPDDVLDLARLVSRGLGSLPADGHHDDNASSDASAVRAVLDPALSGHPAARPDAAALLAACASLGPGEPIRLPVRRDTPRAPARPGPVATARRTRRPGRVVARCGLGVAMGLGIAGVAGFLVPLFRSQAQAAQGQVAHARPAPAPSTEVVAPQPRRSSTSASAAPVAVNWQRVLTGLAAARARAYAAADPGLLAGVDARGSSADAIDRANLAAWQRSGSRYSGGASSVHVVRVMRVQALVAEVLTEETVPGYTVVGASGQRTAYPAGPSLRWQVNLVRTGGEWRTAAVTPADGSAQDP